MQATQANLIPSTNGMLSCVAALGLGIYRGGRRDSGEGGMGWRRRAAEKGWSPLVGGVKHEQVKTRRGVKLVFEKVEHEEEGVGLPGATSAGGRAARRAVPSQWSASVLGRPGETYEGPDWGRRKRRSLEKSRRLSTSVVLAVWRISLRRSVRLLFFFRRDSAKIWGDRRVDARPQVWLRKTARGWPQPPVAPDPACCRPQPRSSAQPTGRCYGMLQRVQKVAWASL